MTIDELAQTARDRKEQMLIARQSGDAESALSAAAEYANAITEWHKRKYPGKRFNKPSPGYLLRAI